MAPSYTGVDPTQPPIQALPHSQNEGKPGQKRGADNRSEVRNTPPTCTGTPLYMKTKKGLGFRAKRLCKTYCCTV